ncbi:MAG: BatD family protein [Bacteroidales bacterium]|nr:BatD family protein [Bacteroidales bacterium]
MKRLYLILFGLFAAIGLFAQTSIKVETHRVVSVDEQFNLTFIIEGENSPSGFSWTPSEDFQLLWGPQQGRSTSLQIVNGQRTKSVQTTYTYVLKPVKAGKFAVPQASAKVKGREIFSEQVQIEVVASSSQQGSSNSQQAQTGSQSQRQQSAVGDGDIFLDVSLSRSNVVVGEPVTATVKLYQRVNVAGFESANFPSFNGFWSQEVESPTNIEFSRETYGGQIYNAAVLRKFLLIPQQQGTITIDPAELVCLINIRVSSGGSSIFDGFFDDYRTVRKRVVSKPVRVNVSGLPAGAPASFGGGVGTFSISAKVSKDTLKTHEAASLLITVSGRGNVSLLEAPKVQFPLDMEVYDTKTSEKIDKNGLSGTKYYEFPFIPRSHGDFIIEPVKYSYYDVNTKSYVTLSTSPIPLVVLKGQETETASVVVPGVSRKDVKNLGSDVRYINVKSPALAAKGSYFVGSAMFWVIVVLLFLIAAVCWLLLRRIAARRADVAGTKNRKATKMAMKRLRLAGSFLKENLYTAFYEELHKALLGFVSDKLNVPSGELSKDNIAEMLSERSVAASDVERFVSILDACEFARYSPSSGHEAMAAHYDAALDVISTIDSNMKDKKTSGSRAVLVIVALMLLPMSSYAGNDAYIDSLWNSANAAYSEGRFEDASSDYMMISSAGLESAALYCNTGNAFYKEGNVPMAILYYERALKLDPSYSDARYNLELLESMIQDRIDPVPELILKTWMRDLCWVLDSDSWAVVFIVFLALTLALLLLFLLAPTVAGRRTGFFAGIVTLIISVFAISFSMWQKNDYMKRDDAIIMRPVISVKSSPSAEASQDLFILHEGTKVKIIDEVGSWNNIELADGRQGWLQTSDIEVI